MNKVNKIGLVIAGSVLLGGVAAQAAKVFYSGASGGDWALDSNWDSGAYPTRDDCACLNNTAFLASSLYDHDVLGIRVGAGGTGVLNIQEGGYLTARVNSIWDSIIGSGRGGNGTVYQTGGIAALNYLKVGDGARGLYSVIGGDVIISRGRDGYSVYLGTDHKKVVTGGDGTFEISGGTLMTRTGVYLGPTGGGGTGTFSVQGSGATAIGIGSQNSGDGSWVQNLGSTLKVGIDASGVTKILIDDVDETEQSVTFEAGSLLDVDYYLDGSGSGTWVVMELENADIIDNGLEFAPGVDTKIWSFSIDNSGANGVLKVTAKSGSGTFG